MDVKAVAAIFQTRLSADWLEVHADSLSRLVVEHVSSLAARPARKRVRYSRRRDVAIVISVKVGLSASIGHVNGASSFKGESLYRYSSSTESREPEEELCIALYL